jgi:hypothetical protein
MRSTGRRVVGGREGGREGGRKEGGGERKDGGRYSGWVGGIASEIQERVGQEMGVVRTEEDTVGGWGVSLVRYKRE